MKNAELVYRFIENVPLGKVTTYGAIGRALSISPRLVGRILHLNPNPEKYPCHRVVKSDGTVASGFAFGGREGQMKKLVSEGIEIKDEKINLLKYQVEYIKLPKLEMKQKSC